MTYDSLLNYYRNGHRYKKNIASLSKNAYRFKKQHRLPEQLFAHVSPDGWYVSAEEAAHLKSKGYDMDSWTEGKLLQLNGTRPLKV